MALLNKHGADIDALCDYPCVHSELFGHDMANNSQPYHQRYVTTRMTPLIVSIRRRQFDNVRVLLEKDADVNAPDELDRTPMMHAVQAVCIIHLGLF